MMNSHTHRFSPLEQVHRRRGVVLADEHSSLSQEDQALLAQILRSKCDYIPNDVFEEPTAEQQLFNDAPAIRRPDVSWYHPVMDNISTTATVTTKNLGTVLLTAAEERALFLQYNYCRYRVAELRDRVESKGLDEQTGTEILRWYRKADALRDQIAQTNLALVLAMAKRTRMTEVDFSDLVSEGNLALLRAVDKFDAARGFKFSTYACRAILKAFSRTGVTLSKYKRLFPAIFDPNFERSDYSDRRREEHEEDCVSEVRSIITENRAELSDIERDVIINRFGLQGAAKRTDSSKRQLTLEQVGKIVGLTKERVRQIQNKALDKVRISLESDFLA